MTNDYFGDITSPTTLRGVTNIIAKSAPVNISSDLTLTDKTYLRFRGEKATKDNAHIYIAPTANDVTLTIDGNSGFFAAYRYSGDATDFLTTPWGMAGIDETNKNVPETYYKVHIGTPDGTPGSTGKGKIVVKTNPSFGYNAKGGFWAQYMYIETSAAAGDDGYIDFLDIANGATADIAHIEVCSTAYPARILFRGSTLFRNNAGSVDSPLAPVTGATLVLQSVNGANMTLTKQFQECHFTARKGGTVRIAGKDFYLMANGPTPIGLSGANFLPWNLSAADNVQWDLTGDLRLEGNTWLKMHDDDLLPYGASTGGLKVKYGGASKSNVNQGKEVAYSCLDLNGTRQHINSFESIANYSSENYRVGVLTNSHASARGTVVFGAQNMNGRLYAKCANGVTVEKEGTGTLKIENTNGETLDVKGGCVSFVNTAIFDNIVTAPGSVLYGTVRVTSSLSGAGDMVMLKLSLDDGAKVAADGTIEIGNVTYAGTALAAGVYEAGTTEWVESGKVIVLMRPGDVYSDVNWMPAGESTLASVGANWSDANGAWDFPRARPVFATSGNECVIDTAKAYFSGMKLNSANDFTIRGSNPANRIALCDSVNVVRTENDAKRVYKIETPVDLCANQTFEFGAGMKVELNGGCFSQADYGIELKGFKNSSLAYDYTDGTKDYADSAANSYLVLTNARVSGAIVHTHGGGWLVLRGDIGNPGDTSELKLDYLRYRNNTNGNDGFLGGGFTRIENATIWKPVNIAG